MRRFAIPIVVSCGSAALLCACGAPQVGLAGTRGTRVEASQDRAATLLAHLRQAYGELESLSGRVTREEIDPESGSMRRSVLSFETDVEKRWTRGLIEESAAPNATGARFVFRNDGTVRVRVKIGFLPITRTFPADDENVTSIRRYRIDQTDFAAMALALLAKGAEVRSLGTSDVSGRKVDLLRVAPSGLPDATHEVIGLDAGSHLPVVRKAYGRSPVNGEVYKTLPYLPGFEESQEILASRLDGEVRNPELDPDGWDL